jgi:uncharacterized protein (DUF433 family)
MENNLLFDRLWDFPCFRLCRFDLQRIESHSCPPCGLEESHVNERIMIDPMICHGKPVIRGTRTPVSVILGHLAGGDSFETIRREYDLTDEDIRCAVAFANEELGRLTFVPSEKQLKPTSA